MSSDAKKSVFVVEDSPEIRVVIEMLYKAEGIEVDFAGDGREALEKLRQRTKMPGVILLDLMMPGMDGYEFKKEQAQDPQLSSIPVLVMTADSGADTKAAKMGANGYLRKPVSIDALIAVANKFC